MATVEKKRSIGDILVEQGVITPLELDEALQRQRLTGDFLGRVLVKMELCEEQDILEALGVQQGMERVDLTRLKIKDEILRKIPPEVARFYNIVPIKERDDGTLVVALADPLNLNLLDDISQIVGGSVEGAVSNLTDVTASIKANYSFEGDDISETLKQILEKVGDAELTMEELGQQQIITDIDNLIELAQQPDIIKMVNLVLLEAVQKKASDVHFEVYENDFRIRLRIDGVLHETVSPPKAASIAVISRVKVLCDMDISERRLPQDSRIELKIGDADVDIRVATLPTLFGECVVMRVLDRTSVQADIKKLGIPEKTQEDIVSIIKKSSGLFLVTGPTGSGKTTTLYACMNELNDIGSKLITCEDPVELQVENLVQVQIREEAGLTFAASLRAILRQDPDIVMVGEVRDLETANMCVEAALRAEQYPHQQRRRNHYASARHGRRTFPHHLRARRRARAAPGTPRLPRLPPAVPARGGRDERTRRAQGVAQIGHLQVVPQQGVSGLRLHRIPRPGRRIRVAGDQRSSAGDDSRPRDDP